MILEGFPQIRTTQELEERTDIQMLLHNNIPGVMKLRCMHINNESEYCFEDSDCVTLEVLFDRHLAPWAQLQKILTGIADVLEHAGEYLLCGQHFVLEPEYIFWDSVQESVRMVYWPEYDFEQKEQEKKLAEYILEHADHSVRKDVQDVYNFFENVDKMGLCAAARAIKPVENNGLSTKLPTYPLKKANICLVLLNGQGENWDSTYELPEGESSVGRASGNDLCLPWQQISRFHAVLVRTEHHVQVTDLDSTNGTTVNGKKISANQPVSCKPGDQIGFADKIFEVTTQGHIRD